METNPPRTTLPEIHSDETGGGAKARSLLLNEVRHRNRFPYALETQRRRHPGSLRFVLLFDLDWRAIRQGRTQSLHSVNLLDEPCSMLAQLLIVQFCRPSISSCLSVFDKAHFPWASAAKLRPLQTVRIDSPPISSLVRPGVRTGHLSPQVGRAPSVRPQRRRAFGIGSGELRTRDISNEARQCCRAGLDATLHNSYNVQAMDGQADG